MKKIIRFLKSPWLPGVVRTRPGHYHGSVTPTSPWAIYVLKSARGQTFCPECTYVVSRFFSIFTIKISISDAATIAQWKDALNDAWADLGELIDTRTQMLEASKELHKYFHDCKDVLGRILEKENSMSEELGRDSGSVSALLRKHQNFLQDLQGKTFF